MNRFYNSTVFNIVKKIDVIRNVKNMYKKTLYFYRKYNFISIEYDKHKNNATVNRMDRTLIVHMSF